MNPVLRHIPLNSSEHNVHSEMADTISDRVNAISEKLDIAPKIAIPSAKASSTEEGIPREIMPVLKERKDDERNESELCASENGNNTTSNSQSFKRYVLIKRLNANAAHVMHVWGPTMKDSIIPVRRVADGQNQKTSGTHSYQVNDT